MSFRHRRIHKGMTHSEAQLAYEQFMKLAFHPDGSVNDDGIVDQKRIEMGWRDGVVPSRAVARAEMKRIADEHVGETDAQCVDRYEALLKGNFT
jgi:hypothetical protein